MAIDDDDGEAERVWQEFWVPILYRPEDTYLNDISVEQVKKELYDFKRVMDQVDKVYMHVTGGKFSKVLTPAEWIIQAADEHYEYMHMPIETLKAEPE